MTITHIERVLVGVANLDVARDRWRQAGFAVSTDTHRTDGVEGARAGAGAVEIDLCYAGRDAAGPLADSIREAAARGGGVIGWIWGEAGGERKSLSLPGVLTTSEESSGDFAARRGRIANAYGTNPNTAAYLEHIVVMVSELPAVIASFESIGVPCKRIREVGNGARQAFFKLEQTVIEVVGPARARAGCWGLAFMCGNIRQAVATARALGLQATEPKSAVQGGLIARIVEPIEGVAIAFMQAPESSQPA